MAFEKRVGDHERHRRVERGVRRLDDLRKRRRARVTPAGDHLAHERLARDDADEAFTVADEHGTHLRPHQRLSRLLRRKPVEEAGVSRPNGLYLVGEKVVLHYTVGGTKIWEHPSTANAGGLFGLGLEKSVDSVGRAVFDSFHVLPQDLLPSVRTVSELAARLRPAAMYYPSVGMTPRSTQR